MANADSKMNKFDPDLLDFLMKPGSYPHNPHEVTHIQTHISHVFIASPYVFKFKKPVNLEFLDFSTLEQRKHYCEQELILNRRLCREIYLEVITVWESEGQYTFEHRENYHPTEYAVRMKELTHDHFLHEISDRSGINQHHLEQIADKLTPFYLEQQADERIKSFGTVENLRVNTDENFRQTEQFIGDTIEKMEFDAIRHFTNRYYELHRPLFERRIEDNRIVDGHGDLHMEHIHITEERICIFDCIEFNERFRFLDLAEDLAFLAMDLDFHNLKAESRHFIEQMAEKLEDPDLTFIIDFYKCYRAYVRGKVKSIQSHEKEVTTDDRLEAERLARDYFRLSLKYALTGSGPVVLVLMGRVASGKSSLADHLSETLKIERLATDIIRKKLAGLPLYERPPDNVRKQIYSTEMHEKTYRTLYSKMQDQLDAGKSVILDATFNRRTSRAELIGQLESSGCPYLFIEATAGESILKKRLAARTEKEDSISDARLEDFDVINDRYETPAELDEDQHVSVRTESEIDETLVELYKLLVNWNLKIQ